MMTTVISIWAFILYISACWDLIVVHKVCMEKSTHLGLNLILALMLAAVLLTSYVIVIIGAPPLYLPYESYCVILYVTIGAISAGRALEYMTGALGYNPWGRYITGPFAWVHGILAVLLAPLYSLSLRVALISEVDWPLGPLENPHFKERD